MRFLKFVFKAIVFTVGSTVGVALFAAFLIYLRTSFPLATPPKTAALPRATTSPIVAAVPPQNVATVIEVSHATLTPAAPPVIEYNASTTPYILVTDSCGPHFEGECLNARSGPGTEFRSVAKLRTGTVLKVGFATTTGTSTWYRVVFDEWLRYPDRVAKNWYVAADHVIPIATTGPEDKTTSTPTTSKRILVDRSDQKLYAYEGDELFMESTISTGLELTPTPRGTFTVFRKTPSRYMQGPLPYLAVSKYYDLPGVPWNLYFTEAGGAIHGAYWHDNFGSRYSSGCVNMRPVEAEKLYTWAEVGTTVTVRD